jgi:two-component system, OmpR family, sensor histidine kinase MtrB
MRLSRGFRGRLTVTVVALVVLTCAALGVSAYALAGRFLHDRLISESLSQAAFDISVLATERLSGSGTAQPVEAAALADAIRLRGGPEVLIEFPQGDPYTSSIAVAGAADALSPAMRQLVSEGQLAYQSITLGDVPYLVVGGQRPGGGADIYLFFSAADEQADLAGLTQALAVVTVVLILIALVAARFVARGVLRPVREASEAAVRIRGGQLDSRVPVASRDEFGQWAGAFNEMAASLEKTVADLREAQARQRRFVSDVSHELRTPLTALVTEADLLRPRMATMDADGRHLGALLVADVARLRALVDDLMELSRFDAGVERVEIRQIDLAQFLRAVVGQRLPAASLRVPEGGLQVFTDPRRLERIVGNLLDNARLHGGGTVDVSADWAMGGVVVRVADRGPGVAPEVLDRIFERFAKGDPSRQAGGSGLGLAIAREHATILGGTLVARPRDGGGLVFELYLPRDVPDPADAVVTRLLHARDGGETGSAQDRTVMGPAPIPVHHATEGRN